MMEDGTSTRVNDVCLLFEAEWQAGHRPLIEAFLPREPSHPDRAGLLRELIRLEIEYLGDEGTPTRREEYEARFPDDSEAVGWGFRSGAEEACAESTKPESGPRLVKLRDHARGGLGVVEVWFDRELNREVAVKRIHEDRADDPASRARFFLEGEITGKLEHPGIVPVYDRGCDEDGRPYYVMRFVRGESLKEAIAAFHNREALADRGTRDFALRKLMSRFIEVGNAIEYAHSKGILHRDLKPSNVMLGPYGETLVVDWGLAKVLNRPETVGPEVESSQGSSGSTETAAGIAMGTPAYMSPEQANGDIAGLGPASDVYSLGATLYAILTGRSPIPDGSTSERLATVRKGEFPRPRTSASWMDPALESICMKAMDLRPGDRYASCRAMASDVERWLADEPVIAYREPFSRRASRFLKRHRTGAAAFAAMAVAVFIFLGIGAYWLAAEARQAEIAISEKLDGFDDLIGDAERTAETARRVAGLPKWDEAIAVLKQAKVVLDSADERRGDRKAGRDSGKRLDKARHTHERLRAAFEARRKDRKLLIDIDDARLKGAVVRDGTMDVKSELESILAAFIRYGIELPEPDGKGATDGEVAEKLRKLDEAIRKPVAYAILELAILETNITRRARRMNLAMKVNPEPERHARIFAAIDRWPKDGNLPDLVAKIDKKATDPTFLFVIGRSLILLEQADAAADFLLDARMEDAGNFWINYDLAIACSLTQPPRLDDAMQSLRAADALRPKSPSVLLNLGLVLKKQMKLEEAVKQLNAALIAAKDQKVKIPEADLALGAIYMEMKDVPKAIEHYKSGGKDNPYSIDALNGMGWARLANGQYEKAVKLFLAATTVAAPTPASPGKFDIKTQGDVEDDRAKLEQAVAESFRVKRERSLVPLRREAYAGLWATSTAIVRRFIAATLSSSAHVGREVPWMAKGRAIASGFHVGGTIRVWTRVVAGRASLRLASFLFGSATVLSPDVSA